MTIPDPKRFYDETMTAKLGADYERVRWASSPLLAAQYDMMVDLMERLAVPRVREAHRVLEAGPGPGTWTKLLLAANPEASYTLVDISEKMLAQARASLADAPAVSFVESDLARFVADEPFDFFFSSRAFEYMPDKAAIVGKLWNLLVPGGRGVIITKMPKPFFDFIRGRGGRALHSGQIAPSALARLLVHQGFDIEEIRMATATVPLAGSAALNRAAYRLFSRAPVVPLFSESYAIAFRKPL